MCPLSGLNTRVTKMLTAADSISVGVCVLPVVFICSVGLVENFFGKLGLKGNFFTKMTTYTSEAPTTTINNYGQEWDAQHYFLLQK